MGRSCIEEKYVCGARGTCGNCPCFVCESEVSKEKKMSLYTVIKGVMIALHN